MSSASGSTIAQLIRRPRYRGFALTVLLSRVGVTMFNTAGVLLVLARTGSAALAGITAAAAVLPSALAGPVLGAWIDVAERRRVLMVIDQLLSAVGLAALLLLAGHAPNWTLPAVAVIYSVTRPLSSGSFYSTLAEIAGPELLDTASELEASSLNTAFVVGPALAGGLAGAAGAAVAIEVQIAVSLVVALLVAVNPAFEVRPADRVSNLTQALRSGTRALARNEILRATGAASMLAAFGWGLMAVGFPLYASRTLHAGAHAGGYLWAAMASGSIAGTFLLRGAPTRARVGASYAILGLSALAWPLGRGLLAGILLICLTGVLEGPAYSGTIALRQRHAPPSLRAQVMTTLTGLGLVAASAGAAIGGAIHDQWPTIVMFTAVNLVAAAVAAGARRPS